MSFFNLFRDFQRTKRPVVPVIISPVVVDIRQTAIVRVATVEPVTTVLKICLLPPAFTED